MDLVGSRVSEELVGRASRLPPGDFTGLLAQTSVKDALIEWMKSHPVRPFELDCAHDVVRPGGVYHVTGDFYCRGLSGLQLFDVASARTPVIHRKVGLGDEQRLEIGYDPAGIKTTTGWEMLKGRHHLTAIFRVLDVTPKLVRGRALLIGQLVGADSGMLTSSYAVPSQGEVHFTRVSEFARAKDEPIPRDIEVLRDIPEREIKKALADLIGELTIPNDSGAERSDLQGTVHVDGRPLRSAFLLKGPGYGFRPLTIKMLGTPGDQIERLYSEPADFLVLQHCHDVLSAPVTMMRAFACQIHRPRLFTVIDGASTLRILRAYGKCGQRSTKDSNP